MRTRAPRIRDDTVLGLRLVPENRFGTLSIEVHDRRTSERERLFTNLLFELWYVSVQINKQLEFMLGGRNAQLTGMGRYLAGSDDPVPEWLEL